MNQISFTANFIQNTTIKRQDDKSKKPVKVKAAIVELDKNDKNDVQTIKKLSNDWTHHGGRYINGIYDRMVNNRQDCCVKERHYYAITTQKKDYDKLNPHHVLGVMLFYETTPDKELNEIKYLEVNPSTSRTLNKERKYHGVGSKLVDYVIETYKEKPIYAYSDIRSIKFYENNNFTNRNDNDFRSFYHEI